MLSNTGIIIVAQQIATMKSGTVSPWRCLMVTLTLNITSEITSKIPNIALKRASFRKYSFGLNHFASISAIVMNAVNPTMITPFITQMLVRAWTMIPMLNISWYIQWIQKYLHSKDSLVSALLCNDKSRMLPRSICITTKFCRLIVHWIQYMIGRWWLFWGIWYFLQLHTNGSASIRQIL